MISGSAINVLDFGAVGDGITNDTAAIRLAIAALADKGTLHFPPGTYLISNAIYSSGAGIWPTSNTTWFLSPGATIKNVTANIQYAMIIADSITDWTLCGGGTIEGYVVNDATENGYPIQITTGAVNITIRDITFINSMADCIYIGTTSTAPVNVLIENCRISGARRNGLALTAGTNVSILNCTFKDTYNPDHVTIQSGLDIEPAANLIVNDVIVKGCTFTGNYGAGMTVFGGATNAEISNIVISDNYFKNNCIYGLTNSSTLTSALQATTTLRCQIINNVMIDLNKRGGIYSDLNRECTISGNSITGSKSTAAHPTAPEMLSGITINACTRVTVTNNSVRTSNYHGYYFFQSFNTVLANNTSDNDLLHNIASQSNTDCYITGNILSNANNAGIYSLNDNYTSILDNRIIDNNKAALVTTDQQGASIVVTYSAANTPTNMMVAGNTTRTPTTTPTYPLKIVGANVTNCIACPNDFRGTFVNAVSNTGTGTILSNTDVVNYT